MITLKDLLECDNYKNLCDQIDKIQMFNISDYRGNYVMHCNTKGKANIFCRYLDSVDRYWQSGDRYVENTYYSRYKGDTVYYFNNRTFGRLGLVDDNFTVLEFDDFNWEACMCE